MNPIFLRTFFLLLLGTAVLRAAAAKTDTVLTFSNRMKKEIKAVVIVPDNYAMAKALPVVYLLHGHGGNYADWITKAKGLDKMVDMYSVIIVCPDGNIGSWYWDSPEDSSYQYETYVSTELVKYIDEKYKTIKDKKGRAITGLSMGGQGAMYLALRHQDVFGAAGSMSGGVDIRPFPNNWDMARRLGSYDKFPERWEQHAIVNMLHLLTTNPPALIIDCGTEDFFFNVNKNLHEQMMYRNIPHDFITRPGSHNWAYWSNAIQYQLLFMHNFFASGH